MKWIFLATLALSASALADSIQDLPHLSKVLISRYDCDALLVSDGGNNETKFQLQPFGADSANVVVKLGASSLTAAADPRSLKMDWSKNGQLVASGLTMIQNSTTLAYVLILADPQNSDNTASLSCSAVVFSDLKDQK